MTLSLSTITRVEVPQRTVPSERWEVGDAVTVDGVRWVIRALNRNTGQVYLISANTVNHTVGWNTTLDKLPEKNA